MNDNINNNVIDINNNKKFSNELRSPFSSKSLYNVKKSFFEAIRSRNLNKVLEFYKSEIYKAYNFVDSEGNNGLFNAIKEESNDLVISIVKELRNILDDLAFVKYINLQSESGLTLIHEAAVMGNIEIIDFLIQNGAALDTKNSFGLNALHIACQEDRVNLVIYLIESLGLDPLELDNRGSMPLHWACYFGSENSARYLCSKISLLNHKINTSKFNYIKEDNIDVYLNTNEDVKVLDKKSKNINTSSYYLNNSFLTVKSNSNNVLQKLPKDNNFLNSVDFDGHSFLHLAAASRKLSLLKFMIMSGVDISIKDNKGRTVNNYCTEKNFYEEIKYLNSLNKTCNIKSINPTKKPKKSKFNIYIFFVLHFLFEILMILYVLPFFKFYTPLVLSIITFSLVEITYILLLIKEPNSLKDEKLLKVDLLNLVNKKKFITNICFKCNMRYEGINENIVTTTHCIVCDKCVLEFNHHCFWINKCIGKRNLYTFYFFLLTVLFNLLNTATINFFVIKKSNNDLRTIDYHPLYVLITYFNNSISNINFVIIVSYILFFVSLLFVLPVLYCTILHISNEISYSKSQKLKYDYVKLNKTKRNIDYSGTYNTKDLKEKLISKDLD